MLLIKKQIYQQHKKSFRAFPVYLFPFKKSTPSYDFSDEKVMNIYSVISSYMRYMRQ